MVKWIVRIALSAIVILAVLAWRQLHDDTPMVSLAPSALPAAAPTTPTPAKLQQLAKQIKQAEPHPDSKLDPNSEEFLHHWSEGHSRRLSSIAATCYQPGLNRVGRHDYTRLVFRDKVVNGDVTFAGVEVGSDSTIANQELTNCFKHQIETAHWHDDVVPDLDDEDELVLSPETGLKKYLPWLNGGDTNPN